MRASVKKPLGVILLLAGFFALLTPLTPGSGLIFVGLELLGIRILFIERIKKWLRKYFSSAVPQKPVDKHSGSDADGRTGHDIKRPMDAGIDPRDAHKDR